jgi:hypothetical protein
MDGKCAVCRGGERSILTKIGLPSNRILISCYPDTEPDSPVNALMAVGL